MALSGASINVIGSWPCQERSVNCKKIKRYQDWRGQEQVRRKSGRNPLSYSAHVIASVSLGHYFLVSGSSLVLREVFFKLFQRNYFKLVYPDDAYGMCYRNRL